MFFNSSSVFYIYIYIYYIAKKMVKTKSSPENKVGLIDLVVLPNSKGFRFDYDVRVRF